MSKMDNLELIESMFDVTRHCVVGGTCTVQELEHKRIITYYPHKDTSYINEISMIRFLRIYGWCDEENKTGFAFMNKRGGDLYTFNGQQIWGSLKDFDNDYHKDKREFFIPRTEGLFRTVPDIGDFVCLIPDFLR